MLKEDFIGAGQKLAVSHRSPVRLVSLQQILQYVGRQRKTSGEMLQNIQQRRRLLEVQRVSFDVVHDRLDQLFDSLLPKLQVFLQFEGFEVEQNMFNVERTVRFDQQLEIDNPVDVTTAFFFQANLYYRGEYRRVQFIILWQQIQQEVQNLNGGILIHELGQKLDLLTFQFLRIFRFDEEDLVVVPEGFGRLFIVPGVVLVVPGCS